MIPLILGGVALAATGYGVAKLLEDECFSRSSTMDDATKELLKGWLGDGIKESNKEIRDDKYPTKEFYVKLGDEACEPQEDQSLEEYDLVKVELYNTTFVDLTTALKEIQNAPTDISISAFMELVQTVYPFEVLSEELKKDFDKHKEILKDAKLYIDSKLDTLDAIVTNSENFEEYSDEEKELVEKLITIFNLIDHAVFSNITNDGTTIAREIKRAFSKVEILVNSKKEMQ